MALSDLLGRFVTLTIRRFGTPGAFLAVDADDKRASAEVVLLLGPEIPEEAEEGDEVRVFIYLDSEGRPLATTKPPKLGLGQVTFLEVTATTGIGAFVDWGLAKELLVPFSQQTTEMRVGSRYPVGLYVDPSGRLAGTMRVVEILKKNEIPFEVGAWVDGEAFRNDEKIGLFVILEKMVIGLVPKAEPHRLARGESAKFRVTRVHPDGKIELSLRAPAHEELESDGARVLSVLSAAGAPEVSDKSDPERIRELFGLSKKAFKRAVGGLLKARLVDVRDDGTIVVLKKTKR
ncbi:MAG: S1-like domain-containing RNA-binding protein [Polyangiaceae bacterium]